jgi:hypothetical protein
LKKQKTSLPATAIPFGIPFAAPVAVCIVLEHGHQDGEEHVAPLQRPWKGEEEIYTKRSNYHVPTLANKADSIFVFCPNRSLTDD